MNLLKTWVRSRWFASAVGLALIAVLIWLGGPYLGLGDRQPLASPAARLALILALVLAWLVVLLVLQWRAQRKTARLSGELAGQEAKLAAEEPGSAERAALQQRFREAIDTLRRTRRNGRNLYALPWYVVIGPPGSGKSTLLQNSGLDFPLSERFGNKALRGIGGTRDCDWWFTDEAVFLDTAGRYTTQDSDAAADASAWQAFLTLLRRYRRRRPLNGVIVTMSVSDLLSFDETARQQHMRAVRRRLDELTQYLKVPVPVYLVFTKSDLVAGFGEFFDDLGPELRAQVWGMTFPLEASLDGSACSRFAGEYDLLLERLNTRLIERLHAERDRGRRAAVLSFPQQLGAFREIARQFVEGTFGRNEYGTPPLLRGAYLPQLGHAGRRADRSHARRGGAHLRRRCRARAARHQPAPHLLRRAPAQGGAVPRIGPGRHQPAPGAPEAAGPDRRLCGHHPVHGADGGRLRHQLRAQPRLRGRGAGQPEGPARRRYAGRAARLAQLFRARAGAAGGDLGHAGFGGPLSRSCAAADALRAVPGPGALCAGAWRLPARARRHPAARRRPAFPRGADRQRQRSADAVRLPEGLPDARRAAAPGARRAGRAGAPGMAAPVPRRSGDPQGARQALHGARRGSAEAARAVARQRPGGPGPRHAEDGRTSPR